MSLSNVCRMSLLCLISFRISLNVSFTVTHGLRTENSISISIICHKRSTFMNPGAVGVMILKVIIYTMIGILDTEAKWRTVDWRHLAVSCRLD